MRNSNFTIIEIRIIYYLVALVALIGGILIYVFFRNIENLVIFNFIPKPSFLAGVKKSINTDTIWGYIFVFNLLHGLWCLSGLLVIRAIWLTNEKWRNIYGWTFITLASVIEILQLTEIVPGTFDLLDLASYFIFYFLESLIYYKFIKRKTLFKI